MNAKKAELLAQKTQLAEILESGKSSYCVKTLRKMMEEIKKTIKLEHDEVNRRIATAKDDMAD